MKLDKIREHMADYLREKGLDVVCAYPEFTRVRKSTLVISLALRSCEGGPSGFRDYLGERYNEETENWEELYGRKITLNFGLDLYGTTGRIAQSGLDTVAEAFHLENPSGLTVLGFSGGTLSYDSDMKLFHYPAEVTCEAFLYAIADEGGTFLDFEVKGVNV